MKYYTLTKEHGHVEIKGHEFEQDELPLSLFCCRLGIVKDGKYVAYEGDAKQWMICEATTGGRVVGGSKTKGGCRELFNNFIAKMKQKHGDNWKKEVLGIVKAAKKQYGVTPPYKTNQIFMFEE